MIQLQSLVTGGRLSFFNPPGTLNWSPDFTPDGKRMVFASNTAKEGSRRFTSRTPMAVGIDRLTFNGMTHLDPKVNPKTETQIRVRIRPNRDAADLQDEHQRRGRSDAHRRREAKPLLHGTRTANR